MMACASSKRCDCGKSRQLPFRRTRSRGSIACAVAIPSCKRCSLRCAPRTSLLGTRRNVRTLSGFGRGSNQFARACERSSQFWDEGTHIMKAATIERPTDLTVETDITCALREQLTEHPWESARLVQRLAQLRADRDPAH